MGLADIPDEYPVANNAAMADACLAAVKAVGKDRVGFINLALDLTPLCNCADFSATPIVPNLGVFAGYDPVAIDKACIDKSREAAGIPGSSAQEKDVLESGAQKFAACSPLVHGIDEELQLNTGEIIGLGSKDYELVELGTGKAGDFAFTPDPRPIGIRIRKMFEKLQPFPYERYEGKGFLREETVDLEGIKR